MDLKDYSDKDQEGIKRDHLWQKLMIKRQLKKF